jgi:hypothetical protein
VSIDQGAIPGSRRSNPATYIGLLDQIRKAFANANSVKPALFSANSEGACPDCNGAGVVYTDLVPRSTSTAASCLGGCGPSGAPGARRGRPVAVSGGSARATSTARRGTPSLRSVAARAGRSRAPRSTPSRGWWRSAACAAGGRAASPASTTTTGAHPGAGIAFSPTATGRGCSPAAIPRRAGTSAALGMRSRRSAPAGGSVREGAFDRAPLRIRWLVIADTRLGALTTCRQTPAALWCWSDRRAAGRSSRRANRELVS